MKFTKWGKRKGRHGDGHLSLDDDTMAIPSEDHQHTVKVSTTEMYHTHDDTSTHTIYNIISHTHT